MALTVVSKPSGFQPVGGGELLYTFTEASLSGKSNYRVEIELNGLSVPIFEFRPDASLAIEADISPMLRSALAMSFTATDRYVTTYVKYQAVWDGGSDAQVGLSGDVIFAYLAVSNNLNTRSILYLGASNNGPMLYPGNTIYCWAGRPAYITFLGGTDMDASTDVYYSYGTDVYIGTFDGTAVSMFQGEFTPVSNGVIVVQRTSPYLLYRSFNVVVLPECSNPVYLKWINDYGGISTWLFDFNQVFGLRPSALYRNKILTVEANNLTSEQWLMLNELNKDGVEYGSNSKSGALVVDYTNPNYVLDVFVESVEMETQTKYRGNQFSIALRYDRLPNILV